MDRRGLIDKRYYVDTGRVKRAIKLTSFPIYVIMCCKGFCQKLVGKRKNIKCTGGYNHG